MNSMGNCVKLCCTDSQRDPDRDNLLPGRPILIDTCVMYPRAASAVKAAGATD